MLHLRVQQIVIPTTSACGGSWGREGGRAALFAARPLPSSWSCRAGATAESKLKSAKENTSLVHKTLMSDAVSPASKTGTPQPALQAALRGTTAANGPTLLNVAFEGSPCTHICVQVSLPAGKRCSGDNIGVMAAIDVLHVRAAGFAPLAVATNVYIQPESCMCVLSGGVLTIRARYNSVSDLIALAERNRPLPVGSIPLRSEVLVDRLE